MKQRCFSHRFSLFIGLVGLLICVVTLTAPTALAWAAATSGVATALAAPSASSSQPNFGPNVYIFNPSIPLSQIQSTVNSIANQQVSNQFGTQRYALLFEPGTYGSSTAPSTFRSATIPPWRASASPRTMSSSTGPSTYTTSASASTTAPRS